jgi:hypothetical protein
MMMMLFCVHVAAASQLVEVSHCKKQFMYIYNPYEKTFLDMTKQPVRFDTEKHFHYKIYVFNTIVVTWNNTIKTGQYFQNQANQFLCLDKKQLILKENFDTNCLWFSRYYRFKPPDGPTIVVTKFNICKNHKCQKKNFLKTSYTCSKCKFDKIFEMFEYFSISTIEKIK